MPVLLSYRNQSTDLHSKSLTGFYMRATATFIGSIKMLMHYIGLQLFEGMAAVTNCFTMVIYQGLFKCFTGVN